MTCVKNSHTQLTNPYEHSTHHTRFLFCKCFFAFGSYAWKWYYKKVQCFWLFSTLLTFFLLWHQQNDVSFNTFHSYEYSIIHLVQSISEWCFKSCVSTKNIDFIIYHHHSANYVPFINEHSLIDLFFLCIHMKVFESKKLEWSSCKYKYTLHKSFSLNMKIWFLCYSSRFNSLWTNFFACSPQNRNDVWSNEFFSLATA